MDENLRTILLSHATLITTFFLMSLLNVVLLPLYLPFVSKFGDYVFNDLSGAVLSGYQPDSLPGIFLLIFSIILMVALFILFFIVVTFTLNVLVSLVLGILVSKKMGLKVERKGIHEKVHHVLLVAGSMLGALLTFFLFQIVNIDVNWAAFGADAGTSTNVFQSLLIMVHVSSIMFVTITSLTAGSLSLLGDLLFYARNKEFTITRRDHALSRGERYVLEQYLSRLKNSQKNGGVGYRKTD